MSKNGKRIISNGTKIISSLPIDICKIYTDAARWRRRAAGGGRQAAAKRRARGSSARLGWLHSVEGATRRPVVVGRVAIASTITVISSVFPPVFVPRVRIAGVVVSVRRALVSVGVCGSTHGTAVRVRVRRVLVRVVAVLARVARVALPAARVILLLLQTLGSSRAGPAACAHKKR